MAGGSAASDTAVIRFVSLEPLLGALPSLDLSGLDWVIVGGVHVAPADHPEQAEQRLIEAFCVGVSSATRTALHDPEQPLPFANLQRRPGVWKRHGLGGYRRVQPRPAPRCPDCGDGDRVLPIVYGSPAAALVEAFERGEVQLGGCTEMPQQWYCGRCGLQWPDALDSVERSR